MKVTDGKLVEQFCGGENGVCGFGFGGVCIRGRDDY